MKSNAEAITVEKSSNDFMPVVINCDRPSVDTERRSPQRCETLQIAFAFVVGCAMALAALLL